MSENTIQINTINEESTEIERVANNFNLNLNVRRQSKILPGVKVHSESLNLDFTCYIQDETSPSLQKCHILTIHDLGCDYTSFQEFISCPEMRGLKDRIIWLHVDLPGQEANSPDLNINKYPSMVEIAKELVHVLDHFKIPQVVCLGEGIGANIAARFAMKHANRCLGVALIHPTGSTASFFSIFKDKLTNWLPYKGTNSLSAYSEAYLIWHRFGRSNQTDQLVQANIKEFQAKLYGNRNFKNLQLIIDAFLNRSNITEKIDELTVDVFIAVGKKAALASETKKFYKALYESRKNNLQLLVNCPLLEVEEVGDLMGETPDRLALSLQFFLQGVGLLPAMPMKKALQGLGRLSRAFSMEEADKPRRASVVASSPGSSLSPSTGSSLPSPTETAVH